MFLLAGFHHPAGVLGRALPHLRLPRCRPRLLLLAVLLGLLLPLASAAQAAHAEPVAVMLVGFDHLNSLYNKQPESDVLGPKKQAELAKLRAQLARFRPEVILLEAEPG